MKQMKLLSLSCAVLSLASGDLFAENLVVCGDFSAATADLSPECKAEAGRISLFTEDRTWNKCARCEITGTTADPINKGKSVSAANVLIGLAKDGKGGFPVTPGLRYEFSFDLKGSENVRDVGCDAVCWTGPDYWGDRKNVTKIVAGGVTATTDWQSFKGSFVVPEGASRACLRLALWSSTAYPSMRQLKVGDHFLVDNVRIARSRKNRHLGSSESASAVVVSRKSVASGEAFSDFVSYDDGQKSARAKTLVRVRREDEALCFDVTAEEPDELVVGKTDDPWSGDTVELFFEGKDDARTKTQVAFNPAGAKYTDGGGCTDKDWALRTKVGEKSWQASVRLPFAFLGWKDPKGEIGFNVARTRPKAHTIDVWSAGGSLHDPTCYGRILVDGYAAAFRAEFGKDESFADRADFERRFAAASAARQAEKLAKFKEARFSVAPVSTLSDWTQPFLPEEVFDPPTEIRLKAAVNEIRGLPLAIANLTGRVEDYRVILETAENDEIGDWGLAGFPSGQVTARRGMRFKDTLANEPSTRFDPLPKMDEVGLLTVPPREAGLVWYDFDCTGVKPGVYRGRLRVIPTCEPGDYDSNGGKYLGKMQVVPVTLEVVNAVISTRPAAPAQYWGYVDSQESFDMAFQIGAECFLVNTWSVSYETTPEGDLDLERPKSTSVQTLVRNHVMWAKKHGFTPKFMVAYSGVNTCGSMYGCPLKKSPELFFRRWPQYVRGVKRLMNGAGVKDEDYVLEVDDEPAARSGYMKQLLEAHKIARNVCPTMRLAETLASWKPSVADLRALKPYCDEWIFWRNGYFSGEYLDFVRELQAEGKAVKHYSCDVTLRLPLLQYYRQHPWMAAHYGLAGADMYQLTEMVCGGGLGFRDFKSIPYAMLFYRSFGTPVPSVRFMALRDGFTDAKFLAALEAKNRTANDPEIAAFLRAATSEVIVLHPNDAKLPDRMRDRARELLAR